MSLLNQNVFDLLLTSMKEDNKGWWGQNKVEHTESPWFMKSFGHWPHPTCNTCCQLQQDNRRDEEMGHGCALLLLLFQHVTVWTHFINEAVRRPLWAGRLRVSSADRNWKSELAWGFLTHWERSRAEEDQNRSAPPMSPFRPLHLRTYFI